MVKNPKLKHWIKDIDIRENVIVVPCPLCGEDVHVKRPSPDEMGTIKALSDLTIDEVVKRCMIQNYNEKTKDLHARPYLFAYLSEKKE